MHRYKFNIFRKYSFYSILFILFSSLYSFEGGVYIYSGPKFGSFFGEELFSDDQNDTKYLFGLSGWEVNIGLNININRVISFQPGIGFSRRYSLMSGNMLRNPGSEDDYIVPRKYRFVFWTSEIQIPLKAKFSLINRKKYISFYYFFGPIVSFYLFKSEAEYVIYELYPNTSDYRYYGLYQSNNHINRVFLSIENGFEIEFKIKKYLSILSGISIGSSVTPIIKDKNIFAFDIKSYGGLGIRFDK